MRGGATCRWASMLWPLARSRKLQGTLLGGGWCTSPCGPLLLGVFHCWRHFSGSFIWLLIAQLKSTEHLPMLLMVGICKTVPMVGCKGSIREIPWQSMAWRGPSRRTSVYVLKMSPWRISLQIFTIWYTKFVNSCLSSRGDTTAADPFLISGRSI